jgi:hypothetical protein
MAPAANVDTLPKTLLGRSKGRWEGDTLVVTTSRIDWPYFDSSGIPQGPSSTIVERFTPASDGARTQLHDDHHRPCDIHGAARAETLMGMAAG